MANNPLQWIIKRDLIIWKVWIRNETTSLAWPLHGFRGIVNSEQAIELILITRTDSGLISWPERVKGFMHQSLCIMPTNQIRILFMRTNWFLSSYHFIKQSEFIQNDIKVNSYKLGQIFFFNFNYFALIKYYITQAKGYK